MSDQLVDAVENGRVEEVARLLEKGADPNLRSGFLTEPLVLLAVVSGSTEMLRLLLEKGADPDVTDHGGGRALHEAARAHAPEMVRLLAANGAALDVPDGGTKYTALQWAVWYGGGKAHQSSKDRAAAYATVAALLDAGAGPDAEADADCSPLALAISTNRDDLAALLLERGADPARRGSSGANALESAVRTGRVTIAEEIARRSALPASPLLKGLVADDVEAVRLALDGGASPEASEGAGGPALLWAARLGRTSAVELLVSRKARVDSPSPGVEAPLAAALRLGHADAGRLLLAAGAKPNVVDADGQTPLHRAVATAPELVPALLAAGAKTGVKSAGDDDTPLDLAVQRDRLEVVDALLSAGANVNEGKGRLLERAASFGSVPLLERLLTGGLDAKTHAKGAVLATCYRSDGGPMARKLLSLGMSPDVKDENRDPALHLAARAGTVDVVDAFLEGGVRKDARAEGWTALHVAAREGHVAVVERLARAGLLPDGKSALLAALAKGDGPAAAKALESPAERGAIEKTTSWSALMWAALLDRDDAARALLQSGANPTKSEGYETPLLAAARLGRTRILQAMVAARVPSAKDGEPALFAAAAEGHTAAVKVLLDAGVSADARGEREPALHAAAEKGHREVVALLLAAGADPRQKSSLGIEAGSFDLVKEVLASRTKDAVATPRATTPTTPPTPQTPATASSAPTPPVETAPTAVVSPIPTRKKPAFQRLPTLPERERRLVAAIVAGDEAAVRDLAGRVATLDFRDASGQTPVADAILRGHAPIVKALLDAGADPNGPPGKPYLIAACWNPATGIPMLLVDAGADGGETDQEGVNALMLASARGGLDVVERLLADGVDPLLVSRTGYSALLYAAGNGNADIAARLLRAGAAPPGSLKSDKTVPVALHRAATAPNPEIARAIVMSAAPGDPKMKAVLAVARGDVAALAAAVGPKPDAGDPHVKWPPILWAALLGDVSMVKLLIEKGADPSVRKNGLTPLSLAYHRGQTEMVDLLLAKGASPDVPVPGSSSFSILFDAAQTGKEDLVATLLARGAKDPSALLGAAATGHAGIVRRLLDAGSGCDPKGNFDRTPLVFALLRGHLDVARTLLQAGASPNVKESHEPLLFWAVRHPSDGPLDLLLEHRVKVDGRGPTRQTALHVAVRADRADRVAKLLAAGADPDAKDEDGRTPLHEAARLGLAPLVGDLIGAGARSVPDRKGLTPGDLAAEEAEVPVVRMLRPKGPLGGALDEIRTPYQPPPDTRKKAHKDELQRTLEAGLLKSLPVPHLVLFEGASGRFLEGRADLMDARLATQRNLEPGTPLREDVDAAFARAGFTPLGIAVPERSGDVLVRLYAREGGSAYGAFNVGMLAHSTDVVAHLSDGSFLSTTDERDTKTRPALGLFTRAFPDSSVSVLLHKHEGALVAREGTGVKRLPAPADLDEALRWVDRYLERRLTA